MKILFLLKQNLTSGTKYGSTKSSGLLNSAKMTANELYKRYNIETKVRICVDGNSIDEEVYNYKPDIVILEAVWVTPEKLTQIQKLHPTVQFYIRLHSELPFIQMEGNIISWCKKYINIPNVKIACNSFQTYQDFKKLYQENKVVYLPNIYHSIYYSHKELFKSIFKNNKDNKKVINIGLFGAIRPMKNCLEQAVAAIIFANKHNLKLRLHINGTRVEQGGNPVLKNIRSLFDNNSEHELIEHPWLDHLDFLELIGEMDLGMQLSFNETFNIVTADFVRMETPIIVSETINWLPEISKANYDNIDEILNKMEYILRKKYYITHLNKKYLKRYNNKAFIAWAKFLIPFSISEININ